MVSQERSKGKTSNVHFFGFQKMASPTLSSCFVGIEVACDSIESVHAALRGGAQRIELCSSLTLGGLTPSIGLARMAVQEARAFHVPVYAMVRLLPTLPQDFVYNVEEMQMMMEDAILLRDHAHVSGFVFGALTPEGDVHEENVSRMISVADGRPVTFHRAFDCVAQNRLESSLDILFSLGIRCVLTSGLGATAYVGKETIARCVAYVQKKGYHDMCILAGCGVRAELIASLVQHTSVRALHGTFSRCVPRSLQIPSSVVEHVFVCDEDHVKKAVEALTQQLQSTSTESCI